MNRPGDDGAARSGGLPALPPAIQRAREFLLDRGPLFVGDVRALLREEGLVVDDGRLALLPANYPLYFEDDAQDRLRAVRAVGTSDTEGEVVDRGSAWSPIDDVIRIDRSRVVVADLETTGLDPKVDQIWELAARNLGTGDELHCRVAIDGENPRVAALEEGEFELSLTEAFEALSKFLADADGIAGHNIAAFDLPFLEESARRCGVEWSAPSAVFDLMVLSTVTRPGADGRTLSDLARATGVTLDPHRAIADVRATAQVIERLLAEIEPSDDNWALATACLAQADNSWPALFPEFGPYDLERALQPLNDPLCAAEEGGDGDPRRWVNDSFDELERRRPNFRSRPSQRAMATAVLDTFRDGGRLAVEAPTGTGKSLAYLLPAVAQARRGVPVVLATATKVLQQQLRRDAAQLRDDGLLPVAYRQIQGVSNYLCTREIREALGEPQKGTGEWVALAVSVRALAATSTGTWTEVSDWVLRRESPGYARRRLALATTANECERSRCPEVARCPLFTRLDGVTKHAGIIAVNHALLGVWADTRRGGPAGPGDVLADRKADLVFDEAHDLEDTLTSAWTEELTGNTLAIVDALVWGKRGPVRLARLAAPPDSEDVAAAVVALAELRPALAPAVDALGDAVATYLHEYGGTEASVVLAPGVVDPRPEYRRVKSAAFDLSTLLRDIGDALDALAECFRAAADDAEASPESSVKPPSSSGRVQRRANGVARDLVDLRQRVDAIRNLPDAHAFIHVLSRSDSSRDENEIGDWSFQRIPIDVGERFARDVVEPARSVVLTSATLLVQGTFDFLARRLGLRAPTSESVAAEDESAGILFDVRALESPFDHDEQSAVVLTSHLPFPSPTNEREFVEEVARDQVGFLSLSGGRTLALFAAKTRMKGVAALVREYTAELEDRGVSLLVQGEDSPQTLAGRFRDDVGSVVYGLRSYWQGFDAPGETLSYLVIEKPPYPHPGDPVASARQRAIADAGGDPFMDFVVPRTAITLAQGFGRLIRHETDRGVAIVYDRRMQVPTPANRMLLETLPTRNIRHAVDRDDAWEFALEFVTGEKPDFELAIVTALDAVSASLEALRLVDGEDPELKLREAAKLLFGLEELRVEQLELMRAFLSGRDALGVLPTGFGKSLCFQLPALLAPGPGVTVVVSPLVALIKDQVDELRGRRGLREVFGITTGTTVSERTEILRDVSRGRVRLLYVSPERFVRDPALLGALAQSEIRGIVVDEAHCVSMWGADFRPEFRAIDPAVRELPRSPRLALTATATPEVEDDVVDVLSFDDPLKVRLPVDRRNLRFSVRMVGREHDRARELLRFVVAMGDKPGIVYASRRATTEELAWLLRQAQITARSYHAGMLREQRDAVQDDFLNDQTRVIVATKAFGMGINKPNIGWVVHYDLPESLEAYAQESGRAAREAGLEGECLLLYSKGDIVRRRKQIEKKSVADDLASARRVLASISRQRLRGGSRVFDPEQLADDAQVDIERLNVIVAWLERVGCVKRLTDCSLRGMVSVGSREPEDKDDRRWFREFFSTVVRAQPNVRKQIDFSALEDELEIDPIDLERRLVGFTLSGHVSFNTSQRGWRVDVINGELNEAAYREELRRWNSWELRRLDSMARYATKAVCRRVSIARNFGDPEKDCRSQAEYRECDVCDPSVLDALSVPESRVPDPEALVQIDLVALQAIGWTSAFKGGRYGEASLKAALLGKEQLAPGRPIGAGLQSCPQFGALRYLHAADRRLNETVDQLLSDGLVAREQVEYGERKYQTLAMTERGQRALRAPHG